MKSILAKEEVKVSVSEDLGVWFIIFSCGDTRNTDYGWGTRNKDEFSKEQARKSGKFAAQRMGEQRYNYFVVDKVYITDSLPAFKKQCQKVGLKPNLSDFE